MKIGIIGAMSEEVEILKNEMNIKETFEQATMKFFEGDLLDKDVVVVTCGIGKVNAAVCTQILIDHFDVDQVINVGIAGGMREDIYPGDVVIANTLVQHDMDVRFFGDPLGQIPRMDTFDFKCDEKLIEKAQEAISKIKDANAFVGRIISGDQFLSDEKKQRELHEIFDA